MLQNRKIFLDNEEKIRECKKKVGINYLNKNNFFLRKINLLKLFSQNYK